MESVLYSTWEDICYQLFVLFCDINSLGRGMHRTMCHSSLQMCSVKLYILSGLIELASRLEKPSFIW